MPSGLRLAAAIVLVGGGLARAQTATWDAGADGDWSVAANWDINQVPDGPGFSAVIDAPAQPNPYTVNLDIDVELDDLTLASDDATLSGMGVGTLETLGTATLTNATLVQISSFASMGVLRFNSTVCDDLCDIFLSHTGTGVEWLGSGDILLEGSTFEHGADSTFSITNAQTLTADPGSAVTNMGTIEKTAAGTTLLTGGTFENPGTLDVGAGMFSTDALTLVGNTLEEGTWIARTGGSIDLIGQTVLTNQADVTLSGAASTFDAIGPVEVNDAGGRLRFLSGASFVTAGDFTNLGSLGVGVGSTFEVVGGSDLTNFSTGTLTAGEFDVRGTLRFDDAAIATIDADVLLSTVGSEIVDQNDADALAPLSTILPTGLLAVGLGRDLTVGGTFDMMGDLVIGPPQGGDRSMVTVNADMIQSGTTFLVDGDLVVAGPYLVAPGGQLRGTGTVSSGLVSNAGAIRPGASPGVLEFLLEGKPLFMEPPSSVEIELGGAGPGEFDQVLVGSQLIFNGPNMLSGTLGVLLINEFVPNAGDEFQAIIASEGVVGEFAEVVTPNLPCELGVEVLYLPDQIVLQIVERCLADCNDDGNVDVLDFVCFQNEWVDQTPCGDCNDDGEYSILDFVCFQNEWLAGCP